MATKLPRKMGQPIKQQEEPNRGPAIPDDKGSHTEVCEVCRCYEADPSSPLPAFCGDERRVIQLVRKAS